MSIRRQSFPANNSDATNAPEVDRSDWPRDVDTPTRTPTTCSLQLISSQKLILVVYVCGRCKRARTISSLVFRSKNSWSRVDRERRVCCVEISRVKGMTRCIRTRFELFCYLFSLSLSFLLFFQIKRDIPFSIARGRFLISFFLRNDLHLRIKIQETSNGKTISWYIIYEYSLIR